MTAAVEKLLAVLRTDPAAADAFAETDAAALLADLLERRVRWAAVSLPYGLIEAEPDRLVGVLTLGAPPNEPVLTNPLPTPDLSTGADLSRLVLLDEVPANAETGHNATPPT